MKNLFILFGVLFVIIGCSKEDTDYTYKSVFNVSPKIEYVAPAPPAPANSPKNVPVIRIMEEGKNDSFNVGVKEIDGFNFEEGFNYVLSVEVTRLANPPADGALKTYRLLEIIRKE